MRAWPPSGEIASHGAWQEPFRPEQQYSDDHQRIEQEAIFLDGLQLLGHDHDDDRRYHQAPGISDSTKKQDGNENERIGKRVVIGRDKSSDHAKQRARDTDEEIADKKRGDLTAHDIEAEAIRCRFIEPQGIKIEPDPRALEPPHDNKGADEQQQADNEIVHVEREREAGKFDVVIERPAKNLHSFHLHALRPAEDVVDLEKGLQQQRKCDGHQRRIVSARAQHRKQQKRAGQRGQQAADQQYDQMRYRCVRVEDGSGIRADAEKRSPREIEDAGVAELDIQAERRDRIEQDRDDQQQYEMVIVEIRGNDERSDDRAGAKRVLVFGEAGADAVEQAGPRRRHDNNNAGDQQCDDQRLLFDGQQRDQIDRGERQRDHPRPNRDGSLLRYRSRRAH